MYRLWMTHKEVAVCQSLEELCSILTEIPQCFSKLQDLWRSEFLCGTRMDHHLNPSKSPNLHINATVFLTARCVYCLHWSPLWCEISTLTYEMNTLLTRKVFSVVLYLYSSGKTNALKSEMSIKICFTAIGWAHKFGLCSAGVLYRGCGAETCNMAVNLLRYPWVVGILHSTS
jgi:hypothetical protein